jgi:1-acyl-sn-glycerol-3-phosphate acyltransferase
MRRRSNDNRIPDSASRGSAPASPDANAAEVVVANDARALDANALCASIESFAKRLNPTLSHRGRVGMDTTLERDLGLDSLSRVELLTRIERQFGASMSEHDMAEAETPRDILRALRSGASRNKGPQPAAAPATPADSEKGESVVLDEAPGDAGNLIDALLWHVRAHPQRTHVHLLEDDAGTRRLSYVELLSKSQSYAASLRAHGHEPGEAVAIMLPTGVDYLSSFVAILLAGGIPVPIYPPTRIAQIEDHFRRQAGILRNARVTTLITFDQAKPVTRLLASLVESLKTVVTAGDLGGHGTLLNPSPLTSDSIAFLQYTSGSTGNPKGVVLTHGNLISSLDAMRQALAVSASDVFVSWLPLYHDMGLIGAWLGSLVYGFPLVLMSPLSFLRRPESWLKAIQGYGGTVSGGPNFAFELCTRRIRDEDIEGLDLSSWRLAFNGAEPVSPSTLEAFAARFKSYGFEPRALTPVYGLAEASLGVAFTPVNRGPRIDRVKRDVLARTGKAMPAKREDSDVAEFVSSGVPIPNFEVRIVDDTGHEAGEREEGALEFKGPATTSGYFRNPGPTEVLFHDEWLVSGDRGYIAEGEVYVTGRTKDVVIRGGRNIYPYELEEGIAEIEGVRRGCVAVFGATEAESGTERLVVVAETRESDDSRKSMMREAIGSLAQDLLGMPADDIVLVPPRTVLKTSSGKIRRSAVRELYETGRLKPQGRAIWLQLLRLALTGLVPSVRRWLRSAGSVLFAGYALALLGAGVAVAWPAVVISPSPESGFRRAGRVARMLLRLARLPLKVTGEANIPTEGTFVLVSNHASYLDGLALVAALPRPVSFVAKRELAKSAFSRKFLRKLGACFVERFDRQRMLDDARAAAELLRGGTPLAYFPEGTLHRMPGLLPFQLGAFAAAQASKLAVVPVIIRGTRSILRGDAWFARRGRIRIDILKPLAPPPAGESSAWEAAVELRDQVRAAMLRHCGEPDLAERAVLQDLKQHLGRGEKA